MDNLGYFDATQIKPFEEFEPIPAGEYLLIATASELKTSAKGGRYYAFTFEVADGPYKGRKIFENFNIENDNVTAVNIAMAKLSALTNAVGKNGFNSTSELHGRPFPAKLGVQAASNGYEAKNNIKAFLWKKAKKNEVPSDDNVPF